MIKTISKISFVALTIGVLALPGTSQAAGGAIIGTQAAGSISGGGLTATSGLAGGVMNLYYQGKLSDKSAFEVHFMTDSGLSVYGAAYKGYFGNGGYANAPFWRAGASLYDLGGLASATTLDIGAGYDFKLGNNFVMGLEGIYAYSIDSGGSITNLGVNVGYMF